MGSGTFDRVQYAARTRSVTTDALTGATLGRAQIFKQREIDQALNPYGVNLRESRDSVDNPKSRAIILALDVTGSMGKIAENMARSQLQELMENIFDKSPITNPHIMLMGIGDINASDQAPLQVSQFEADIRVAEQLEKLWLESGGGGNDTESYDLPWYFAANHTSLDCFEKRGEKGYLFTIGDECAPSGFTQYGLRDKRVSSLPELKDRYEPADLFKEASKTFEVFHIIVEEGDYFKRRKPTRVLYSWKALIGRRAIRLSDYRYLPQVVSAVIRVNEGEDPDAVIQSYPECTMVVSHALYSNNTQTA